MNRRTVWFAIRAYGELAGLPLDTHPHMLRYACGFALADQGADTRLIQDYLGHRNIQHTVRYTATNPAWFERQSTCRRQRQLRRSCRDTPGSIHPQT